MMRRIFGVGARLFVLGAVLVLLSPMLNVPMPGFLERPVSSVQSSFAAVKGSLERTTWTGDDSSHASSYSFMAQNPDGTPGRWNPCEPIRYQVNAAQAEPGAIEDVQAAFAQITAASGLQFQYLGPTTEVPQVHHEMRSGGQWSPVIIGWAHPDETDMLSGAESGMGGPDKLATDAGVVYVSGTVALDSTMNSLYPPGFNGTQTRGSLLLHELGHLVGISHTDDTTQMMREGLGAPARYGAGDLAGLAQIGAGAGCIATPAA